MSGYHCARAGFAKTGFTLLAGLVLLAAFSLPAQARGWFLGGGIVGASFEKDLDDIDNGGGITFSGGFQYGDSWSAEILAGGTYHEGDIFEDDTLQSFIMTGAKFSLGSEGFRPYGVIGFSWNRLAFGDIDDVDEVEDLDDFDTISGLGYYFGIGADIFVARQHAINIGYRSNRWNGDNDNTDYDVRSDMFSIAYNFYFSD